jgi:hypothetical protein
MAQQLVEEDMKISNPKLDWYMPRDWRAILAISFGPILVLLVAAMLVPPLLNTAYGDPALLWKALIIGCIGVVLLFMAKMPLYRQHKYHCLGPRLLPTKHRRLYWIS